MRSWDFYAPNVIFADVLFVLCGKMTEGTLDAATHKRAVDDFQLSFLPKLLPPPIGAMRGYLSERATPQIDSTQSIQKKVDEARIGSAGRPQWILARDSANRSLHQRKRRI